MKKQIGKDLSVIFIVLAVVSVVIFRDKLGEIFKLHEDSVQSAQDKLVTCGKDDTKCIKENAKNLTNQLTGNDIEFARHQCDGPHPCKKPGEKDIQKATEAIRTYTKDSDLQVFPVNGVNRTGIIYYCADDTRCWKMEVRTNRILSSLGQSL